MTDSTFRVEIEVGDPGGRRFERVGRTWVRIDGEAEMTLVVFADAAGPALLGTYALEGLRLAADPVGRRLLPVPGLLLACGVP